MVINQFSIKQGAPIGFNLALLFAQYSRDLLQVLRVSQFDKREKLEEILNADDTVAQKTLVFVKLKRTADFLAT